MAEYSADSASDAQPADGRTVIWFTAVAAGARLEHSDTAWPTMTDDDASPQCAHLHVAEPKPKPDAIQGRLLSPRQRMPR
jgi:hypothetical protein